MNWRPNATGAEINRYISGSGERYYVVSWENSWGEIADPDDSDSEDTPEDGEERFSSLDAAFAFIEKLIAAVDALGQEPEAG